MALDKNTPIFDDVSFSDLARDIYTKKKQKDAKIEELIQQLAPLVKNITDASMLVPLIKEYLDISVKNDEILIKLSGIVQKLIVADSGSTDEDGGFGITKAEKEQLMKEAGALRAQLQD